MKNISLITFVLISIVPGVMAQKVYTVAYDSQSDITLFETKNKSEADILIYKVSYASQVNPSKGLWMDVRYRSEANWIVSWAKYRSQSSCLVYFVPYRSQAKRNICFLGEHSKR